MEFWFYKGIVLEPADFRAGLGAPLSRRRAGGEDLSRLVLEPTPGFGLDVAGGLADGDFVASEFGFDLGAGQEMQAAHQHGGLDHRRLRAIETFEGRM